MEKNPGDFQIQMDGDNDEFLMQEELREKQIEKLSHRITIIAILIPVLIGVIFTVAYLDIKKRVFTMHDTGVAELKSLSEDLESKFSSLSVRYAKLEENFTKREEALKKLESSFIKQMRPMEEIFLTMEKGLANLKSNVTQALKELDTLKKKKVDKAELNTELKTRFDDIDESFTQVYKDMESLAGQMKTLDKNLKEEMLALTEFVGQEKKTMSSHSATLASVVDTLAEIKKDLKKLKADSQEFVSLDMVKKELNIQKYTYEVGIEELRRNMEKELNALKKKLSEVTVSSDSSVYSSPQPPAAPPTPSQSRPGGILEQDIQ